MFQKLIHYAIIIVEMESFVQGWICGWGGGRGRLLEVFVIVLQFTVWVEVWAFKVFLMWLLCYSQSSILGWSLKTVRLSKLLSSLYCSFAFSQGSDNEQQFYSDLSGNAYNTKDSHLKKKELSLIILVKLL